MNKMIIGYHILLFAIIICVSGNITLTPGVPEVGQNLTISCSLSGDGRYWFIPAGHQIICEPNSCSPSEIPAWGYTFRADFNKTEVIIQSLKRSRDEGDWKCSIENSTYNIYVWIYTIAKGLQLTQEPDANIDLSVSSAKLQCRTTSCVYPKPAIVWLYKNQPTSTTYEVYTATIPVVTVVQCASSEMNYISSLSIAQYTTWGDNSDKTVTFACRIGYIDPSKNITTIASRTIQYAVRVAEVVLQQNNQNITDPFNVTSGESNNLTCVTGTSRPAPRIDWYIGSQWKGSETILSFIPSNADHEQNIFCQAYNINASLKISSNRPKLFVRVRVTEAVLQQNNQNITSSLYVTSGEPVNLTCVTGTSRPAPTIDWYIGSQLKGNGTSLTFTPSNADHNQTVFCQVYNIIPSLKVDSNKPSLFVRVIVTNVTLEGSRNGTAVFYDGFSKTLRCISSSSRPAPTVTWWLGNRQLTDNITNTSILDINGLHMITSEIKLVFLRNISYQKIHCEGSISIQENPAVSIQVNVDVWYQPNMPEVKPVVPFPWLENWKGIMQCYSTDYGNPNASAKWIINGFPTDTQVGNLVIQRVESSHNGKAVSCQLVNNYTADVNVLVVSNITTLNVEYSPIIEFNTSSNLTVNETESINVFCNVSGNPRPDPPQWRGRSADSILRLSNISRRDNGTYICNTTARLHNLGIVEKERGFQITVQYAPDLNAKIDGLTQQNMSSAIICEARGFPSRYTFHPWTHMWGNIVIRSETLIGRTNNSQSILVLGDLSLQDMGTYICSVDNGIKGINGNITQTGKVALNITGMPNILIADNHAFPGATAHLINISIPFYSDPAIGNFTFQKSGTSVMNSSRTTMVISSDSINYKFYNTSVNLQVQVANLFIQNLTQNDFDNYTLVLENPLGTTEYRFFLNASGAPLKSDRFYFNRFIGNNIEMHFVPGFNGGIVQTFVIEYQSKTSSDSSWRNTSVMDLRETEIEYRLPNGTFYVNVTQPSPGSYVYRMYSWNIIGRSPYSAEITVFIPRDKDEENHPDPRVAAIAGGVGAAAGLIIAVILAVIIIMKRRSYLRKKSYDGEIRGRLKELKRPESGLVDNPVYDTSDQLPGPSTTNNPAGVEYAAVVKNRKTAAHVDDPNKLYAQVKKIKNKKGKEGALKGKHGKAHTGDVYKSATLAKQSTSNENVYENSEVVGGETSGNAYENPKFPVSQFPVESKDGLMYADLMLGFPTIRNGKPVIWGVENRTEYAEIAYGKRGVPLHDSDMEQEDGGTEKIEDN